MKGLKALKPIAKDLSDDKEYNNCLRCGRKLKNPESRKVGYGVCCLAKVRYSKVHRLFSVNNEPAK